MRLPVLSIYDGFRRISLINDVIAFSLDKAFRTNLNPLNIMNRDWNAVLSISL